jgi:lipopolysaccharide transport system ATP-binding protein
MSTIIKVEGLSKIYDLGLVGTGTLSKDLNRTWAKITGKPDPYATISEINDRTVKSVSNSVSVLKDINFDVQQGDVLGIIGKNGAGKSTLLKILSQITSPTYGNIKIKGRVASLLEVGTGMHPEMTARQNIYLNGSIMGMRRNEITLKLDEIIDFAGIGKYIDTPIKRFSSGMQVRLGFAVAAFLEPEILIVDEVLAVGDAEFQKKAIGKMKDVSKGEGRTVLFVSHNMAAVKSLCTKAILLDKGQIEMEGDTDTIISKYLIGSNEVYNFKLNPVKSESFDILEIGVKSANKDFTEPILRDEEIALVIKYDNRTNNKLSFTLKIKGEDGQYCMTTSSGHVSDLVKQGIGEAQLIFPKKLFNDGTFYIDLLVVEAAKRAIIWENDIVSFLVNPENKPLGSWMGKELGYFRGNFPWINSSI